MTVRAKKVVKGQGRFEYNTSANDVLKKEHPANEAFRQWVEEREQQPTRRQARKFLQKFPHYRNIALTN